MGFPRQDMPQGNKPTCHNEDPMCSNYDSMQPEKKKRKKNAVGQRKPVCGVHIRLPNLHLKPVLALAEHRTSFYLLFLTFEL